MKAKLCFCTVALLLCSAFFAVPAFATEKSTRAVAIANTLERYQVSPDWQPDIENNFVLLDELYVLVNSFEQGDIDALGGKFESIKKYYTAYCAAKGIDGQMPSGYEQSASAFVAPQAGSCREQANAILQELYRGGVNYTVNGDVATNSNKIEEMLLLVYDYTEEELATAAEQEQRAMLNYFTSLYKYRGWDVTELDLLFTTIALPNEGVVLAPVVPERSLLNEPIAQNIAPTVDETKPTLLAYTKQDNEFVSGLVAVLLWLGILTAIVIFLKQRTEKHGKA